MTLSPKIVLVRGNVHIPPLSPGLKQENTESPQIKEEAEIKEDPEGQSIKQEEEQLPVCVAKVTGGCVKTEGPSKSEYQDDTQGEETSSEKHLDSETEGQTEHSSDTDDDDNWGLPFTSSAVQKETDGYHCNRIQIRNISPQNLCLYPQSRSASETSTVIDRGNVTGTGKEAGKQKCTSFERKQNILLRPSAGNPYSCPICEKVFTRKRRRDEHLRIHTGEKPYSCSVCKKTFTQKRGRDSHMRIHTGERPYICPVCQKTFSHKSHRDTHLRIHARDKPHICSMCMEHFSLQSDLDEHMKTHIEDKPYSCSVCNRTFILKYHLDVHMAIHRVKRYCCSVCKKTFTIKWNLDAHMRVHTGEKPYNCSVCDKPFSQLSHLKRHMNIHKEQT